MKKHLENAIQRFVTELEQIDKTQKALETYSPELQLRLNEAENTLVKACKEYEINCKSSTDIEEKKKQFRNSITHWYFKSYLCKRAITKPKGYLGDYETLELIYNNEPVSSGIGRYLDYSFLNHQLAVAVRNRKDLLKEKLISEIRERERERDENTQYCEWFMQRMV